MRRIYFVISTLLLSSAAFSQGNSANGGDIKKNAVSFSILGTTPIVGLTYERILSNHLSIEAGIGLPSFGLGVKVFFSEIKEQKMMFNTGLTATYVDFGDSYLFSGNTVILYLPIGLSYYGVKGFNFGIDLGPALNTGYEDAAIIIPYGGIKLGKRF
ncbi:hypothetical protein [Flavobacterium sp. K5-23]|uniref:hypothetical protein n=1 Tax=Flavobacterium sp. K5-23 TaxID=2746225 RepID=UPI00200FBDCD|nr:hypothetical protein [Flavobacterium sp. K5-23]UQD55653.1 hypothetical protein FLAK523_04280 [Flavobacterium sp. K5-23]